MNAADGRLIVLDSMLIFLVSPKLSAQRQGVFDNDQKPVQDLLKPGCRFIQTNGHERGSVFPGKCRDRKRYNPAALLK